MLRSLCIFYWYILRCFKTLAGVRLRTFWWRKIFLAHSAVCGYICIRSGLPAATACVNLLEASQQQLGDVHVLLVFFCLGFSLCFLLRT
jgi:hypothetical protein